MWKSNVQILGKYLSRQSSGTEPWQLDNHHSTQSGWFKPRNVIPVAVRIYPGPGSGPLHFVTGFAVVEGYTSFEPRLSVLDFVSQLWRNKIRNGEPGFEARVTPFVQSRFLAKTLQIKFILLLQLHICAKEWVEFRLIHVLLNELLKYSCTMG